MWLRSSTVAFTHLHIIIPWVSFPCQSVIVTCYLARVFCILVVLKHRLLSTRSRASKCLLSPQMILRLHWWDATTFSPDMRILQQKKWDTRMSNLTMKWDSSRKLLLDAVLSCEGLPSPNICPHCCEGKVLLIGDWVWRREHVDVFLCAPIKSLIFSFPSMLCL